MLGLAGWTLDTPARLKLAERVASVSRKVIGGPDGITSVPFAGAWFYNRNLPNPPKESFRRWWERTGGGRK